MAPFSNMMKHAVPCVEEACVYIFWGPGEISIGEGAVALISLTDFAAVR